MDALTPLSAVVCGQIGAKICYLNEGTVIFAAGNGLVLQDIDTGAQAGQTHDNDMKMKPFAEAAFCGLPACAPPRPTHACMQLASPCRGALQAASSCSRAHHPARQSSPTAQSSS